MPLHHPTPDKAIAANEKIPKRNKVTEISPKTKPATAMPFREPFESGGGGS
jgi:hypothetical protein